MKVMVHKDELLSQLPRDLRYLLIASTDGLPPTFEFEALPKSEMMKAQEERATLKFVHPKVHEVLTPVQWEIFCDLLERPKGAIYSALYKHTFHSIDPEDTIRQQIRFIRDKFKANSLPFTIENQKKTHYELGRYLLIPLTK